MPPDFSARTVDTLWKRAASMCSNPSCRATTSGPTGAANKAANIGDAAHIFGARPGGKRYRPDMTDFQRAEITNGIWLCRNCHGRIDGDELRYTADVLLEWRASHEAYVLSIIGRQDEAVSLQPAKVIDDFRQDTAFARQILRDALPGWEYRLAAELLSSYLTAPIRRWRDLESGLYCKPKSPIDDDAFPGWAGHQMFVVSDIVAPVPKLINVEILKACGEPGVAGDPYEIRHTARLIGDAAERMVDWEEGVAFVRPSEMYECLHQCLPGLLGTQMVKLADLPPFLHGVVDWHDVHPGVPRVFEQTVVFDLPKNWLERINREMEKVTQKQRRKRWLF